MTVPVSQGSGRYMAARARVGLCASVGVAVTAVTGLTWEWRYSGILGWDAAALLFAVWIWASVWGMDAATTAAHATREDPSRRDTDLIVLGASVASLAGVAIVLLGARSTHDGTRALLAALGVLSVAISWLTVHTLFTLLYALRYYEAPVGGIDFNQQEPPRYSDFAYLAFTLGMTYQVSDTNVERQVIRAAVLRHSLLSYLFGSVVLATIINLLVSLTSGG